MRTGYSILIGEYIDAARLTYGDCKGFQVVCPNCKEPIFKVERRHDGELHYLSHYASAKAFAADCELRVGNIGHAQIEQHNHDSREQRLKYFLSVLRRVVTDQFYGTGKEKVPTMQRLLNRSKAITVLRETSFKAQSEQSEVMLRDFEQFADSYIKEGIGLDDPVWNSGFAMSVQVRIARDMMTSLLTQACRENFYWLWNHAYVFLESRLIKGHAAGILSPDIAIMLRRMSRMTECSRDEGKAIVSDMVEHRMYPPDVVEPGFRMLMKLLAEVQHEMVGCLIRLPYFELLREAGHV